MAEEEKTTVNILAEAPNKLSRKQGRNKASRKKEYPKTYSFPGNLSSRAIML